MAMVLPPAVTGRGAATPLACAGAAGAAALARELECCARGPDESPNNVAALLRAGWASLGLGDTQAALGFFRRARAGGAGNGEVKAGEASALLRQDDPVAAVRLFAAAEAAGAPMVRYGRDRGLALDLVGNNVAAQQFYSQALALGNDPEIVRRLALSEAIAGDESAAEATLLPLLQSRTCPAYRTRAFALAILGKGEEAVSIAKTAAAELSNRMAPYLRYMPRLTRAQQAAAANLGQVPAGLGNRPRQSPDRRSFGAKSAAADRRGRAGFSPGSGGPAARPQRTDERRPAAT